MDASIIVEMVLGGVVALMLYFLKVLHGDVRQNTKGVGENKGRIQNLNTRIQHEAEIRNQTHGQIMDILQEIKDDIKQMKR